MTPVEALPGAGGSGADDAPMANTGGRRPEGSGTRRRHEVPTHLDVEDRLMLGLSSRQVAYLLIGLAASIGLWSGWPQIPDPLRLALALVCLGATAAVALVHWNGHGPIEWAFIGLRYAAGARRAVWQPAEAARAGLGSPGGRRHAVQSAHVGIADVADATVHLADGRHRAVLEVGGVDFQLRRADEQEALITAYAAFLNALSFPVQIMVRVQPVDLETHIRHLEQRARGVLAPDLAILAHDHVTFLRRLAGQQALLERRFYVVVPADDAPAGAAGSAAAAAPTARATFGTPGALLAAIGRAVHARLSRSRRPHEGDGGRTGALSTADAEPFGRHTAAPTGAAPTGAALEQLDFRCAEVIRQLGRCGLTARRLDTAALVRLFYTTWCPDLAGVQRRRQPVAAGTVPVVRRAGAGVHPPTASPPPPPHAAGDAGVARPGTARHFVRGMRTVADLVAPAAVEVTRDHVRVDHHFRRTLAVTGYPRTVGPGWLAPLLYASETLELSLHVQPLPTGETVRHLSHKLVQLHSSRLVDARGGRLADPEREIAYDDVERLRDALQRGEERVFATSLYLHLRAHSIDGLDGLTRRVEAVLDGMLAQSRVALLQQDVGLRSCLPLGDDRLLVYRNLDTSSLATTFPFAADALTMERGVFYGVARHGHTAVVVDPFDPTLENANTAVIATSGAGKSYFTKLMALRHGLLGVDVLVIDPEDEYHRLCIAVGGQYLRFSATARERLNPFDLPPPPGADRDARGDEPGGPGDPGVPDEDVLAEQVTALIALLEIMVATPEAPLTVQERAVFDRALYATYSRAGITARRSTHARPAPLLRDLYAVLVEGADDGDATAAGLASRLHRYVAGSLAGLFNGPTNVALDRPFVVFNIQRLEPELRPLAIHVITTFVWGQVRRARRPRLLVVDEAWSVLQYREGGAFLAGLARRARKYYLGLVTITQSVTDFLATEAGRAVLANAALKLLMKQDGAAVDRLVALFDLTAEERQFLLAAGKGEGLLLARGGRVALQIRASAAEHRLATTAPHEVQQLEAPPGNGASPAATADGAPAGH